MARPAVILVGADKGGVGKTTVARTLLDYFGAHQMPTRAFDTESPRGTLKRFHPDVTEVVDVTAVPDQMKIFDTLSSSQAWVTVIDVRAGLLSSTLQALSDIGFLESAKKGQITFAVFHILGPSIASLDEIAAIAPYVSDGNYFMVKNHVNDTTFFEWDPETHAEYFEGVVASGEITIPKLRELAYEQVEIAGAPFLTFVANETTEGKPAEHSFVLRGYVRSWLARVADEFQRVGLLDLIHGAGKGR